MEASVSIFTGKQERLSASYEVPALFLSVPTIITLFKNRFVLGFQTSHFLSTGGLRVFAYVLPHGIFEIPAIIIAGTAGFKIPYEIIRYLAGNKETILTKEDIKEYMTLALISIILIAVAAWIEAYITPRMAEYYHVGFH